MAHRGEQGHMHGVAWGMRAWGTAQHDLSWVSGTCMQWVGPKRCGTGQS